MLQVKRRLRQAAKELTLYLEVLSKRGTPRLAVLPSYGRSGASLLRGYNIASELQAAGWQTIVLSHQLGLKQRDRILRRFKPDLVLVQSVRHPLNRAEYLADWPIVYDIDDAHFLLPELEPAVKSLVSAGHGVLCGSRFIADWVQRINPRNTVVWTGAQIDPGACPAHAERRPIVTWAQLGPDHPRYRAELDFVADVMSRLSQRRGGIDLRVYSWNGPRDLPALTQMKEAGVRIEFMPRLGYDDFMLSLRDAAVGLSAITDEGGFAQGKSFGKILCYLDAKVPVVCSDAADHGLFFRSETGVVSNDAEVWIDAIDRLLDDPERRAKISEAAYVDFVRDLSVKSAARQVEAFLKQLLDVNHGQPASRAAHDAVPSGATDT